MRNTPDVVTSRVLLEQLAGEASVWSDFNGEKVRVLLVGYRKFNELIHSVVPELLGPGRHYHRRVRLPVLTWSMAA